jgi:SAM-dependent MidA family methyltransferase
VSKRSQLPDPAPEARTISDQLRERIVAEIERDGPISFERYMELALYQPGLGYYSAGAEKFGAGGDFVTAPELGDVFARCLAVPVADTLSQLGGAGELLELGAGSGQLACDLMLALDEKGVLPQRYRILELSADLRQRQQAAVVAQIPQFLDRFQWLEQAPDEPFDGVILGNEVVDALPARRFIKRQPVWCELRVGLQADQLVFVEASAREEHRDSWMRLERELTGQLAEGYISEFQPQLAAWVKSVSAKLIKGRVLLIDYGYPRREYYHPDRTEGTLLCHYRHHVHHDPFWYPGLNDLSVNVEFTALAEALADAGFEVDGLTSQVQFLIGCGLGQVVGEATEAVTQERINLVHQVQLLTQPAEMGERMLVLTGARGVDGPAPGFTVENRLDRL